jgi:hypothetical protein
MEVKMKIQIKLFALIVVTIYLFTISCAFGNKDVFLQIVPRIESDYGGQETKALARIKNTSNTIINSANGYFLSYHLLSSDGKLLEFDGLRTPIQDLKPGQTQDIEINIKIPVQKGNYILEADVVKEGEYWLSEKGSNTSRSKLIVKNDEPKEYDYKMVSSFTNVKIDTSDIIRVPVHIQNEGKLIWQNHATNPINFSFHIFDENGEVIVWDGPRYHFFNPIRMGEKAEFEVEIKGSLFPEPGEYIIEFDLVQEGQTWFKEKGVNTVSIKAYVN